MSYEHLLASGARDIKELFMMVSGGGNSVLELQTRTLSKIENMQIFVHRVSCEGESQGAWCKK